MAFDNHLCGSDSDPRGTFLHFVRPFFFADEPTNEEVPSTTRATWADYERCSHGDGPGLLFLRRSLDGKTRQALPMMMMITCGVLESSARVLYHHRQFPLDPGLMGFVCKLYTLVSALWF